MHSHVRGSHCVKFDDDDFNTIIVSEESRVRVTDQAHRYRHGVVYSKFVKFA